MVKPYPGISGIIYNGFNYSMGFALPHKILFGVSCN